MPWSRCADMAYLLLSHLHKVSARVQADRASYPERETIISASRLLPVGFRTEASTSYIPMTVLTRSSVNTLLLATHMSIIPSFSRETRDTAHSSSYPPMTTRDGQTDCRSPVMPPTRSTLQVFRASSRRTTCRSMTRWS